MTGPAAPIKVLVCDDQALVRAGYATIFASSSGLEVVGEAADGEEAVRIAGRLRPDVVVMDVHMPGMGGIEATRQLVGPGTADVTRVLVVTNFHTDEYVYEALRAGASGFLLKDATPDQLIEGVLTVAAGESLLSPAVTRGLIGRYAVRIRPTGRADSDAGPLAVLSPRELQALRLIAVGKSNAEIAEELVVSRETAKTYVSRILTKLDLRDRVQAVVLAHRVGLVSAQE